MLPPSTQGEPLPSLHLRTPPLTTTSYLAFMLHRLQILPGRQHWSWWVFVLSPTSHRMHHNLRLICLPPHEIRAPTQPCWYLVQAHTLSHHRNKNMTSTPKSKLRKKVFEIVHKDIKGNSKLPWASRNNPFYYMLKITRKLSNDSGQCSEESLIIT